ncbi:MAG: hypothetical protein U9Q81_25460 [Pseudomonadota bacterium]|nr:hypothetical protein [Pseudomonadota bacterium]
MDNKREEIMSAMQSVAEDLSPASPGAATSPSGVKVDIGGIHVSQAVSSKKGSGPRDERPSVADPPLQERRRDCQRRNVLRLLGIFLLFTAILPLYLVDILPNRIDNIALWIGFVSLVGSMVSFATMSVYENA